ncbi:hypothetical protein INS49_015311 [Diaporthe citri]|uniref:uncharacterized protein n=1 Tax=Diaporthe citri TaxID=83186 RepID=UPI001C8247E6|nr:uncharacterized protein INS49_015311 [Diaporthe citri]KAG6355927.1 hypothetical protein INS49_015311 [Diaporthe citri]
MQPRAITILETVPDEVLREMFLNVAAGYPGYDEHSFPVFGPHPLLPVVQVNRRFNTVANPLLVRNWQLSPAEKSGAKFVLHLLKHPDLRSQVRSLALYEASSWSQAPDGRARREDDNRTPRAPHDRWPQTFCSTVEMEQLAQSAEETYPTLSSRVHDGEEDSWAGQIRQRSPCAIAALVLAWATGLQELDLMVDAWTEGDPGLWMMRLVRIAVGVQSPLGVDGRGLPRAPDVFTKLRCVSLGHYGPNGLMHAAAFFRLPSLRVFKALGMDIAGLTLDVADPLGSRNALQPPADHLFPNGTSSVEELHLLNGSLVTDNGFRVLTRSCRRLRVLILQSEWNDTRDILYSESIAAAIRLHSASLEKILIEGSDDYDDYLSDSDPGSLGDCLLPCVKLESLVINLVVLYGREHYDNNPSPTPLSELLPPGLTDLGLSFRIRKFPPSGAGQATKDNIVGLLRQCGPKGRFSRLKKIDLVGDSAEFMEDQEIIALAKKAEMELTQHDGSGGMV